MKFETSIARLEPKAPTLCLLLKALQSDPCFDALQEWIYNGSQDYTNLGTLLSEMHPAYDGLIIEHDNLDGHNAFEEFCLSVFDAIIKHNQSVITTDKWSYDATELAHVFYLNIVEGEQV